MTPKLAIGVRFPNPIEPLSDEEGYVPGMVEDHGFDRQATLVSGDRTEIVVTLRKPVDGDLEGLQERLREIYFGLEAVDLVEIDTSEYYHSAAVAAREVEA